MDKKNKYKYIDMNYGYMNYMIKFIQSSLILIIQIKLYKHFYVYKIQGYILPIT
jgi:hypothetical protein